MLCVALAPIFLARIVENSHNIAKLPETIFATPYGLNNPLVAGAIA